MTSIMIKDREITVDNVKEIKQLSDGIFQVRGTYRDTGFEGSYRGWVLEGVREKI